MTWADFYLICFLIGFALSFLSVLTGTAHVHLPDLHFGDVHVDGPHVHGAHLGSGDVPWLNLGTIAGFLAWFGGTGYLLVRFSSLWIFFSLGLAILGGLAGAAIVFLFLAKVLMRGERVLDPADYEMVGVFGSLASGIRQGGTGELIFSQGGARHSVAARSEDGSAVETGAEVVVTRYEKGIAYVRRWEELAGSLEADLEKE